MRGSLCLFTSAALHAAILGLLLTRSPLWAANAAVQPAPAWLEVVPPPPPPAPPAEPPPPAPRPTLAPKPRSAREPRRAAPPAVAPSPALAVPDAAAGTLAIQAGESGPRPSDSSQSSTTEGFEQEATEQVHAPRRVPRGVELSLWMDRLAFEQRALVRPGLAIITAVPGLRDLLRGSNIRPLLDLERLRVTLHAPTAQDLTLAGVHLGGEPAMRDAAKRIAAMRQQEPVWRGGSKLQATSWVDGSGVDRGLALHDGTFLIGARESMPALLGTVDPAERLTDLSRLRKRVFFAFTLEDAARYLPTLSSCTLQALRVSVASTSADLQRLSLRAEYESPSAAAASAACVRALGERAAAVPRLVGWLEQAIAESGSYTTQLNVGVTGDELQSFLDELAWVLRSASRS